VSKPAALQSPDPLAGSTKIAQWEGKGRDVLLGQGKRYGREEEKAAE